MLRRRSDDSESDHFDQSNPEEIIDDYAEEDVELDEEVQVMEADKSVESEGDAKEASEEIEEIDTQFAHTNAYFEFFIKPLANEPPGKSIIRDDDGDEEFETISSDEDK